MKRIVFAVTTDLNFDQRMQRICHSLQVNGYQVTLVGRELPNSKPLSARIYNQYRLRCIFKKGKLFYIEYNLRLFIHLKKYVYDAYCAIDLDTALAVCFRANQLQKPFIYDAHEYFPEMAEVTNRPTIKYIWQIIEKFVFSKTNYIYTVSASIAEIFRKKYQKPISVIRNLPYLEIGTKKVLKKNYILYQGAVNAGRGLEFLIKAMPEIPLSLWICGDGDILNNLQKLVSDLQLENKVFFKGHILPVELKEITCQAYIGINLLENLGLSYYYSLSNKFFDYVQAGIPQVMVAFPEYKNLNEIYAIGLYTDLEPQNIAYVVNKLILDDEKHAELSQNCQLARQELNWQQEEKVLLQFYKNIWPEKV